MALTVSRRIGDIEVVVLTDGSAVFEPGLFPGADHKHIAELLEAAGETEIRTNFNAVLIRTGGMTVLADSGPRDLFGPMCGNLQAALADRGVEPGEVDRIFLTHLHPDHAVGCVAHDGTAAFPNAELVLTEAERHFWSDNDFFSGHDQTMRAWQALAKSVLAAYSDRLVVTDGEAEIAPGMTALPLPGHTPGHSGYRIASGGQQLVHVGDIVHAPSLQVADPRIAIAFDIDPGAAAAARMRLLDQLATDDLLFTGGHFLFPAFGRVERAGVGYHYLRDAAV